MLFPFLLLLLFPSCLGLNVILYLADDLGVGEVNRLDSDTGFDHNPLDPGSYTPKARLLMPTPNLERLARLGTRLQMSYSPSSKFLPTFRFCAGFIPR